MIDLQCCNEEQKQTVDDLIYMYETGQEFFFTYKGRIYHFDYSGGQSGKICVYEEKAGTPEFLFDDLEDFMQHFEIDGKSFQEFFFDDEFGI